MKAHRRLRYLINGFIALSVVWAVASILPYVGLLPPGKEVDGGAILPREAVVIGSGSPAGNYMSDYYVDFRLPPYRNPEQWLDIVCALNRPPITRWTLTGLFQRKRSRLGKTVTYIPWGNYYRYDDSCGECIESSD